MMNNKGKKKIWFTIEEFKSQLVTDIKPCKIHSKDPVKGSSQENGYEIQIKHPNTSEILMRREIALSELKDKKNPWNELAAIGAQMKAVIKVDTEIQQPIKKAPAPKKGKMDTIGIINH